MSLPDDWKIYKNEIAVHFKEGFTAINTAFTELETMGYITKKKKRNANNQFIGWEYTIWESLQDKVETTKNDNCRQSTFRPVGDPLLLNPKELKEKENKNIQKKDNKTTLSYQDILTYFPNTWKNNESFQTILKTFHIHRKELHNPLRIQSTILLSNKLIKMGLDNALSALQQSIESGWTSVYPPKSKSDILILTNSVSKSKLSPDQMALKDLRYKELAIAFLQGCFEPAQLFFNNNQDPSSLCSQLLQLYHCIDQAHNKAIPKDFSAPLPFPDTLTVVSDYLQWIKDNEWITDYTLHMFTVNHVLFQKFRRYEATLDTFTRDPLTGVSYERE